MFPFPCSQCTAGGPGPGPLGGFRSHRPGIDTVSGARVFPGFKRNRDGPKGVDQINMNPKCRLGGSCQKGVDALSILGDFVLTILPEVGQNAVPSHVPSPFYQQATADPMRPL